MTFKKILILALGLFTLKNSFAAASNHTSQQMAVQAYLKAEKLQRAEEIEQAAQTTMNDALFKIAAARNALEKAQNDQERKEQEMLLQLGQIQFAEAIALYHAAKKLRKKLI